MAAMKAPLRPALALLLFPLVAGQAQAPATATTWTTLAPGVRYQHISSTTPAGEPWSIHVLEISRNEKSIELRAVAGVDSGGVMQRELPTAIAARVTPKGNVVAVVNGDYDLPAPYLGISDGLSVTSGQIWTTGKPAWPNFVILRSGEPLIGVPEVALELSQGKNKWRLAALNKPFGSAWSEGPRVYTSAFRPALKTEQPFDAAVILRLQKRRSPSSALSKAPPLQVDATVRGAVREVHRAIKDLPIAEGDLVVACRASKPEEPRDSACDLRVGQRVALRTQVRMAGKKGVRHAIGGFPILVENGRRGIVGTPGENLRRRHPRTAVCTSKEKIIFVVVDGRQPQLSAGMTLEELGDLMVSLGCTTAMNTDGGGSSVMAIALSNDPKSGALQAAPIQTPTAIGFRIVNSPSDGNERGRGNAWVIVRKP